MNGGEKDPAQCRILRQADRRFNEDIKRSGEKRQRVHDQAVELRQELSRMRSDLRRLKAMEAGAGALGGVGRALSRGALDLSLGVRVSVLEGQIGEKEMELNAAKAEVDNLRYQTETAISGQKQNGIRMKDLNCVG